MDKSDYKAMLADSIHQEGELTKVLKTIKTMVHDTPNNMELGKKIRSYFLDETNKTTYIYESPDGGKTVYRRKFGDHSGNKEKMNK